jgi:DNA primase
MKIPDHIIERINQTLSIVDIVGQYLTLRPAGGRYVGLCPFHQEKTPSFSVTPDRNLFYCFGCHKGGNIFTFVMEMEKVSFSEAAEILAKKAGISIEPGERTESDREREALFSLYERLAGSFHAIFKDFPAAAHARDYLARRGISEESIEAFQIGYAPADRYWLKKFLLTKNFSEQILEKSGLFSRKYPDSAFFSDRIIFPIYNGSGRVVAFGGRLLSGDGPKYLNSPETAIFKKGDGLFGLKQALPEIKKAGEFILVEGYVDVIAMHQAGIRTVVAPLGTAFTEQQAFMLKRFVERGILLFDGDAAGVKATKRAVPILEKAGLSSRVIALPSDDDPADILQKQGAEALHNLVKYPINSFEYLVKLALIANDASTPEGKEAIVREVFPYIEGIESEVKRESCLKIVSEALQLESRAVYEDFKRRKTVSSVTVPEGAVRSSAPRKMSTDLFLMIALIAHSEMFPYVRSMLTPDDFADDEGKSLFILLEDCYRKEDMDHLKILARIENEGLKALVLEKLNSGEFELNQDRLIKDSVLRMKLRSLDMKRQNVSKAISRLEKEPEAAEKLKDLISEKMYLDEELSKLKDDV